MTIPDGHARYRYVETYGEWSLSVYSLQDHVEATHISGHYLGSRPQWLVDILAVAAIAEQYHHVPNPPPDTIVWFDLDTDNNLAGFPYPPHE